MDTKQYQKEYAKKNRKKLSEYSLEYYYKNNLKEYQRDWYKKNLLENREKRRKNNEKRRLEIIIEMGSKCKHCGYDKDIRALQIDHVNGQGNKERKSFGHSQSALNKKVRSEPVKYQLLCANCNWIKRYEQKELLWEKTMRQSQ